jgi:hypothetical protein
MLPQLAQGPANKIFVIPSEFNQALQNIGGALSGLAGGDNSQVPRKPRPQVGAGKDEIDEKAAADAAAAAEAAQAAAAEAAGASQPGGMGRIPPDPDAPAPGTSIQE